MNKIKNTALALPLSIALGIVPAASAAVPGDLDRSFDGDGKLVTEYTSGNGATALDSVIDGNGRLVVVGGDSGEIGVARFNPDGSPDTSFGGDGTVLIDSGATASGERARAVTLDSSGNILVFGDAGLSGPGNVQDLVFARLEQDGDLDPTFDGPGTPGNGKFRVNLANEEAAADLVVDTAGKIVFAAGTGSGPAASPRVGRLETNGALDTDEFASPNGNLTLDFQAGSGEFVNALALQPDGKILVAGDINGTATYAVARVDTAGALDTTFNSSGTIPGVARPPLPAGHISARAFDLVVDTNGITVAGNLRKGSAGGFDTGAALSRLTTSGTLDTAFGNTSGFAFLSPDLEDNESFSALSSLDGRLFAGGTAGDVSHFVQLAALFTSAGALDTSFASPNGFTTSDLGVSATAVAAPVAQSGVAYLVGQGNDGGMQRVAASAVCLFMPPACPSPDIPVVQTVSPASGSNDNSPSVSGAVPPGGAPVTSISIYRDADCAGPVAGSGSPADFQAGGIQVSVPDNSTTTFYARANGHNGSSACSSTSVTYTEVTPPMPPAAQASPVAMKKKCKKAKKKAASAKKKCKKKRK